MKRSRKPQNTYFDANYAPRASNYFVGFPQNDDDARRVDEDEQVVFADVLLHEHHLYEHRGAIAFPSNSPVKWAVKDDKLLVRDTAMTFYNYENVCPIPILHDTTQISLSGYNKAVSVIYITSDKIWVSLVNQHVHEELNCTLICGGGLPRFGMRKLVATIVNQMKCPFTVFSDNDTWGYFTCSMFLRGTLVPSEYDDLLSVQNLKLGGITADDAQGKFGHLKRAEEPETWRSRINAMRNYKVFATSVWQEELETYVGNKGVIFLNDVLSDLGDEGFRDYFISRL